MQLVGYVDGIEVKFDFYPPNIFKAKTPRQIDGTYILQLHVIDEAGNITNYSNIFIKIDFQSMAVKILPENYLFIRDESNTVFKVLQSDSSHIKIEDIFTIKEICFEYCYRELVL